MKKDFISAGGGYLLIKYHTLYGILSNLFPEQFWEPGNFFSQEDIWKDIVTAKYFIEKPMDTKELHYLNREIIKVRKKKRCFLFFQEVAGKHEILPQLLSEAFPQYNWGCKIIKSLGAKKSQYLLKQSLKTIFPGEGNSQNNQIPIFRTIGRLQTS
jgi:hypothetical protein